MRAFRLSLFLCLLVCKGARASDFGPELYISVRDQKLAVADDGKVLHEYPISTSRFGIGDEPNSYKTPLGTLWVYDKIGGKLPLGAVIKNRQATGEVIPANAAGQDPIVTRVIWLKGLFGADHAFERCIYIHGTPEEKNLGKPASYGCIRMRSADVAELYPLVSVGTHVTISDEAMNRLAPGGEKQFWLWGAWDYMRRVLHL